MGVYSTDTLHLLLGFDGISWVCKSTQLVKEKHVGGMIAVWNFNPYTLTL